MDFVEMSGKVKMSLVDVWEYLYQHLPHSIIYLAGYLMPFKKHTHAKKINWLWGR